jgi:hypothetical protein
MGQGVDFPYQLIEIINGTFSVALLWMMGFLVAHIIHAWLVLKTYWGWWTAFWKLYHTNKPEIALTTIVFFLCIRTFVLWYLRFIKNNRYDGLLLIVDNDAFLLIVTTSVIILAIACWIRVISPIRAPLSIAVWAAMLVSSLGFGLGMHYFF